MGKILGWLVVIGIIYFAYQAGWFNSIYNYFTDSANLATQEQVIETSDGTITTVRYKSIFDILLGR